MDGSGPGSSPVVGFMLVMLNTSVLGNCVTDKVDYNLNGWLNSFVFVHLH